MFKSMISWFENKKSMLLFGTFVFLVTIILRPHFEGKLFDGKFEGDIQNKLVWSVKGECYFVKPTNQFDVMLVRVNDCDRK